MIPTIQSMSEMVAMRLTAALEQLKSAARARHLLSRASPGYQAALDREMRIATEIRRLAASDQSEAEQSRVRRS